MCTVSNKLKLCTCKTKDVEQLKHYWILKRPNEKTVSVVGEMILPAYIGEAADKLNEKIILTQLNTGNCFDIELQHQENDILELHFTCKADPEKHLSIGWHGDFLCYAFTFKKNKWKKGYYDPYKINFDKVEKGRIKNSFVVSTGFTP